MDDMDFKRWMHAVDTLCGASLGLTTSDLPDYNWRDLAEDGASPKEAWESWLEDNEDELEAFQ